jgi:ribosome maturation factor RimP
MENKIEKKILEIIEPVISEMGYEVVAVSIKGGSGNALLEILAQNPETRNLGVDECAKISREISAILDVEDPISGKYRLEVSSPGIDRPLTKKSDFVFYEGFEAKIEISPPLESGQKRFRGILKGENENNILLETDQGEVALPYDSVHKAKLVLTDELIKAGKTN